MQSDSGLLTKKPETTLFLTEDALNTSFVLPYATYTLWKPYQIFSTTGLQTNGSQLVTD